MEKLKLVSIVLLALLLVGLLTYGAMKATSELTHVIEAGISNMYFPEAQ